MTWQMRALSAALKIQLQIGSVGSRRLLKCAKMGLLTMLKSVMSEHAVSPLRFATHRATLSLPLAFRRFQSTELKMTRIVWSARSGSLPLSSARDPTLPASAGHSNLICCVVSPGVPAKSAELFSEGLEMMFISVELQNC